MRASVRWTVIVVVIGLLLLLAWSLLALMQTRTAAAAFEGQVATIEQHAAAVDTAALSADLPEIRDRAHELNENLSSPPWAIAARLPWIGGTADSARRLASAAVVLADGSDQLDDVLPQLNPDSLRSEDGVVDTGALLAAAPALDELAEQMAQAAPDLAQADPGSLGPVGPAVRQAQQAFAEGPARLHSAAAAMRVAARLLGANGPTDTMVLLQNGSEARGTGGFLGAYSLAKADKGRVRVGTFDSNNSLTTPIPNQDMPPQFLQLWGRSDTAEWASYNLSRHFPYTGELTRSGMTARGEPVDNVIAIDAHVVAALLAGTGPITADGATVDAANAVEFFNRDVYTQYPDTATKDAVVVDLMGELTDRLTTGEVDLRSMFSALREPVGDGRLLAWSQDQQTQSDIDPLVVSGVVPNNPGPWTTVALNNSAGNKLDAYVSSTVNYRAASCGVGLSTTQLTLHSEVPSGLPDDISSLAHVPGEPAGSTRLMVDVYGPMGAHFRKAVLDGRTQFVQQGDERGHPVWRSFITLRPGESRTLSVSFSEPDAVGRTPQVLAQPMAIPQEISAQSTC